MNNKYKDYAAKLNFALSIDVSAQVQLLADTLYIAWENKKTVFICGNGGSAGNAI